MAHWPSVQGHQPALRCTAFLQVQHGQFTSVFGDDKNPFVCFQSPNATTLDPVPFPNELADFFNSPLPTPKTS